MKSRSLRSACEAGRRMERVGEATQLSLQHHASRIDLGFVV